MTMNLKFKAIIKEPTARVIFWITFFRFFYVPKQSNFGTKHSMLNNLKPNKTAIALMHLHPTLLTTQESQKIKYKNTFHW